jgi:hypothetical protein
LNQCEGNVGLSSQKHCRLRQGSSSWMQGHNGQPLTISSSGLTIFKKDLLTTGLVLNQQVLNDERAVVSEVTFRKDIERRIIKMDKTHHDLSITGEKCGPRAVSYHKPAFQRDATRGVKSARHVTGAFATNAAGEALPPF